MILHNPITQNKSWLAAACGETPLLSLWQRPAWKAHTGVTLLSPCASLQWFFSSLSSSWLWNVNTSEGDPAILLISRVSHFLPCSYFHTIRLHLSEEVQGSIPNQMLKSPSQIQPASNSQSHQTTSSSLAWTHSTLNGAHLNTQQLRQNCLPEQVLGSAAFTPRKFTS